MCGVILQYTTIKLKFVEQGKDKDNEAGQRESVVCGSAMLGVVWVLSVQNNNKGECK